MSDDITLINIPTGSEVDPAAMLLVAQTLNRRYRRGLKEIAAALQVTKCEGSRAMTDHELIERVVEKASTLMGVNARRMKSFNAKPLLKGK